MKWMIVLALAISTPALSAQFVPAAQPLAQAARRSERAAGAVRDGLLRNEPGAFQGYTLFAPLRTKITYLIDMRGRVIHTWSSGYAPGNSAYLLDDGRLLRAAREPDPPRFRGGGIGGRVQILSWEGEVLWDYRYADDTQCHHHDVEPLPNGNVLLIAWETRSTAEAIAAGCDPETIGDQLWPDTVVEVRPRGKTDGDIVWRWRVWDHLVQDQDASKANFGVVADHPERIDVNFDRNVTRMSPAETARLRDLGYVGGDDEEEDAPEKRSADWLHTNAIAYNAKLDQIVLSVLGFNELWVIDHSTTTEQAAGHRGGRYGKGGDLLYRWGNPQACFAGTPADQTLFGQHDVHWIPPGSPGGGNLLVFNNGRGREDGRYSSVDEIATPLAANGSYATSAGQDYGPPAAKWRYTSTKRGDFFAGHISGAQRLPNGNTLICSGEKGRFFEVDTSGKIVWEYLNPYGGDVDSDRPGRGPPPQFRGDRRPPPRAAGPPPLPGDRAQPPRGQPARPPGDRRDARGPQQRGGQGPRSPTAVFRATRISPDHPGLKGKALRPKTDSD